MRVVERLERGCAPFEVALVRLWTSSFRTVQHFDVHIVRAPGDRKYFARYLTVRSGINSPLTTGVALLRFPGFTALGRNRTKTAEILGFYAAVGGSPSRLLKKSSVRP
jgi:hypothetical protein